MNTVSFQAEGLAAQPAGADRSAPASPIHPLVSAVMAWVERGDFPSEPPLSELRAASAADVVQAVSYADGRFKVHASSPASGQTPPAEIALRLWVGVEPGLQGRLVTGLNGEAEGASPGWRAFCGVAVPAGPCERRGVSLWWRRDDVIGEAALLAAQTVALGYWALATGQGLDVAYESLLRRATHTMNNPLMALSMGVELLRDGTEPSADDRAVLEDMHTACVRLRDLIRALRTERDPGFFA